MLASEVSTLAGSRDTPAIAASTIDRTMNRPPRIAVERVRKSAAPRAVMNPDELPPTPSPPPSERCIRMTPTSEAATSGLNDQQEGEHGGLSGSSVRGASRRSRRAAFNRACGGLDDRQEIVGLQAGAADQRAIDVGDRENLRRVRGLDRAAVEDADLVAGFAIGRDQALAERAVHFGDVGRSRRPCRCRSPRSAHRRRRAALARRRPRLAVRQAKRRAGPNRRDGLARFAHSRLSPTHRITARPDGKRGLGLGLHVGVAFALRFAPLGMADDGQACAGIEQHGGADAAGMRALLGEVDVLRADRESRAPPAPRARSGSPARTARHRPRKALRAVGDRLDLLEVGREPVHLPVSGDQLSSAPSELP